MNYAEGFFCNIENPPFQAVPLRGTENIVNTQKFKKVASDSCMAKAVRA